MLAIGAIKRSFSFLRFLQYVLLAIVTTLSLIACEGTPEHHGDLSFFIPDNSVYIIRTSSLSDLSNDLENNALFAGLKEEHWYNQAANKLAPLKELQLKNKGLVCIGITKDSLFDVTLITTLNANFFANDTISASKLTAIINGEAQLDTIGTPQQTYYTAVFDSIVLATTNKELLEKAKSSKGFKNSEFLKINKSLTSQGPVIFMRKQQEANWLSTLQTDSINSDHWFGNWTGLSLQTAPGAVRFSGVSTQVDSLSFLSSFNNSKADSITAPKMSPANTKALFSFTYQDFQSLVYNDSISPPAQLLGNSSSELSGLVVGNDNILLAKTVDPAIAMELLAPYLNTEEPFRGINRYVLRDSLGFGSLVKPVLKDVVPKYAFLLDNYLIFTPNLSSSEAIIQAYLSNNTLRQQVNYQEAINRLGTASHLLILSRKDYFKTYLNNTLKPRWYTGSIDFKDHEFFIIQFTKEPTYSHIHGIAKEEIQGKTTNGIRELLTIKPKNKILQRPQFFSNHRTNGKDIVFQDVQNKLYFYAANGKLLWSKQLKGPILGKIQEVDLLRNGKKQLAFCTPNAFMVLDRNGDQVAPFPLNFKNEVTQPLAIFDYDNNRKYRFVVTQEDEILMYNSSAKIVKGFTYTKAEAPLALPPEHIRMGRRDYLVFALSNGDLKIKSRVGKDRVKVTKSFAFGPTPVYSEDGTFVVIDNKNNKNNISQAGVTTIKDLGVATGFTIAVLGKTKASLDENLLRINGRLYELPYGVYAAPVIYQVGRDTYVSVTDLQEKKVYVFNSQAELLPNFPVYGTAAVEIGDANRNRRPNILVQGDGNTILLYEIQ